jgi:hypothetical protein
MNAAVLRIEWPGGVFIGIAWYIWTTRRKTCLLLLYIRDVVQTVKHKSTFTLLINYK